MKKLSSLAFIIIELAFSLLGVIYRDVFYIVPALILGLLFIVLNINLNFKKLFLFKIKKKTKVNTRLLLICLSVLIFALGFFIVVISVKKNKASITNFQKNQVCNENETLRKAKQCVFPIIRDDDGHGSGFSIKNGFIITNKHVIEGATKLYTKIQNEEIELKVWNYSPSYDLAVLKISRVVPTCDWFNSEQLNVAESLYAVGWPLEYNGESTVSKGVFSRLYEYDSINYIQTDTSINPGNSGGPLVNKCGVVGINTIKIAAEGIEGMGFALPSSELIKIVDRLIEEGSDDTEIPLAVEKQNTSSNTDNYTNPSITRTVNVEDVKSYLNNLYSLRNSWDEIKAGYNYDDWKKLIDSFNRQIDFCETLVKRLSERGATQDDVFMWDSIIKMSYETAYLTNKLNGN